jgi:type VI protein secretion system component Hcp
MTAQEKGQRSTEMEKTELTDAELEAATGGKGSQSTGAGAGKVSFSSFSITRKMDKSSPIFFQN